MVRRPKILRMPFALTIPSASRALARASIWGRCRSTYLPQIEISGLMMPGHPRSVRRTSVICARSYQPKTPSAAPGAISSSACRPARDHDIQGGFDLGANLSRAPNGASNPMRTSTEICHSTVVAFAGQPNGDNPIAECPPDHGMARLVVRDSLLPDHGTRSKHSTVAMPQSTRPRGLPTAHGRDTLGHAPSSPAAVASGGLRAEN
jgi:hypothetical protein